MSKLLAASRLGAGEQSGWWRKSQERVAELKHSSSSTDSPDSSGGGDEEFEGELQEAEQRRRPVDRAQQPALVRDKSVEAAVLGGAAVRIPVLVEGTRRVGVGGGVGDGNGAPRAPLQTQATLSMNGAAAPVAAGRPLNRAALNRAKFAIRSYTIAVSVVSSLIGRRRLG